MKVPAVYMMASRKNGTIYTGVTSNHVQRVWQHRNGTGGFTNRYACKRLVWYEVGGDMVGAITREKQIKGGSRARKIELIVTENPDWQDLFDQIAHP